MRHEAILGSRFFFATGLMPCPYLPGRLERRVVTELVGRDVPLFHNILSQAGFRRSHDIVYAPACPDCSECKAVRVISDRFKPTKSMRRVLNINSDLICETVPPTATDEQFAVFSAYQATRHRSGEMARMDAADYQALIENSPVKTKLVEFRVPDGHLIACCLVDHLNDGLSAVYSFFDSTIPHRSLGTLMILWTIREAQRRALPHTYLGYWIADCQKMAYKARFSPVETYTTEGWKPL